MEKKTKKKPLVNHRIVGQSLPGTQHRLASNPYTISRSWDEKFLSQLQRPHRQNPEEGNDPPTTLGGGNSLPTFH